MDQHNTPPDLSRRERRQQRRLARDEQARATGRSRAVKRLLTWLLWLAIITVPIAGFIWYGATRPPIAEGNIVSRKGLHWHPELSISIEGAPQEIPPNLGIGAVHNPIHTHDSSGVIHLEFQGLVTKDDLRLAKLFKVWGTTFTATCIIEQCNGTEGQVKMTVNGEPNAEFDRYFMRDKDKIEIRFE